MIGVVELYQKKEFILRNPLTKEGTILVIGLVCVAVGIAFIVI